MRTTQRDRYSVGPANEQHHQRRESVHVEFQSDDRGRGRRCDLYHKGRHLCTMHHHPAGHKGNRWRAADPPGGVAPLRKCCQVPISGRSACRWRWEFKQLLHFSLKGTLWCHFVAESLELNRHTLRCWLHMIRSFAQLIFLFWGFSRKKGAISLQPTHALHWPWNHVGLVSLKHNVGTLCSFSVLRFYHNGLLIKIDNIAKTIFCWKKW